MNTIHIVRSMMWPLLVCVVNCEWLMLEHLHKPSVTFRMVSDSGREKIAVSCLSLQSPKFARLTSVHPSMRSIQVQCAMCPLRAPNNTRKIVQVQSLTAMNSLGIVQEIVLDLARILKVGHIRMAMCTGNNLHIWKTFSAVQTTAIYDKTTSQALQLFRHSYKEAVTPWRAASLTEYCHANQRTPWSAATSKSNLLLHI